MKKQKINDKTHQKVDKIKPKPNITLKSKQKDKWNMKIK